MAESIEDIQRPLLEVIEIPIDAITPDELNPNRMDEPRMDALMTDIQQHGFARPLVVRPLTGDRYRLIDGEHRWRALRDLGFDTAPCVVDDAPEDEAHMRMISINLLHGRPDPVKQARILVKLVGELGEQEVLQTLGLDDAELAAQVAPALTDDFDARLSALLAREEKDAPEVLKFQLGPRQAKTFESAIAALTAEGKTRAEALVALLDTAGEEG